ncbi:MAG: hypothetical protein DRJ68_07130 [Thermoprotei archaeon]|nr:MAG: hypothetical protein DRJ68_07130 [Thermoprotei archaeon]
MKSKLRSAYVKELIATIAFTFMALLLMIPVAAIWPQSTDFEVLGLPFHYIYYIIAMLLVAPLLCFTYTKIMNRVEAEIERERE